MKKQMSWVLCLLLAVPAPSLLASHQKENTTMVAVSSEKEQPASTDYWEKYVKRPYDACWKSLPCKIAVAVPVLGIGTLAWYLRGRRNSGRLAPGHALAAPLAMQGQAPQIPPRAPAQRRFDALGDGLGSEKGMSSYVADGALSSAIEQSKLDFEQQRELQEQEDALLAVAAFISQETQEEAKKRASEASRQASPHLNPTEPIEPVASSSPQLPQPPSAEETRAHRNNVLNLRQVEFADGTRQVARVRPVAPDGNCGFGALGTLRLEFRARVLDAHARGDDPQLMEWIKAAMAATKSESIEEWADAFMHLGEDGDFVYWMDFNHFRIFSRLFGVRIRIFTVDDNNARAPEADQRFVPFVDDVQGVIDESRLAEPREIALAFTALEPGAYPSHFDRLLIGDESKVDDRDDAIYEQLQQSTHEWNEEDADEDFEIIERTQDFDSLLTYDETQEFPFGIHPILGDGVYDDILHINDWSYEAAKTHSATKAHKQAIVDQCFTRLALKLSKRGFNGCKIVFGKTGKNNSDDDAAVIVTINPARRLVVVAFHGSRNGSYLPIIRGTAGDWGANWDAWKAAARDLGLDIPEDTLRQIWLHRGFGNNYMSVHPQLLVEIQAALTLLGEGAWVMFTGHSKGAAVASIAAPYLRLLIGANRVQMGAILLSVPKVFDDAGRAWVHRVFGKRNIFRINVHGDPVPMQPGLRSIGVLFLDVIEDVNERARRAQGRELGYVESFYGYHYGFARNGGIGHEPVIVVPYEDLLKCLKRGIAHLRKKGIEFMTSSTFRKPGE